MLVAYLTTDPTNQELAAAFAARCGATLCPLFPRDERPDGRFDAVLYDLDYLPPRLREEVLTELLANPPDPPAGVHTYNLGEEEVKALSTRGVVVFRRLRPALFRILLGQRPADC